MSDLGGTTVRIAREGIPVITLVTLVMALPVLAVGLLWPWGLWIVVPPALLVVLWAVWFFRDPDRPIPTEDSIVISPADGVVIRVDEAELPAELRAVAGAPGGSWPRVTVFLNIFNVHVNRVPIGGTVEKIVYTPGKFLTASLDKAGIENERSSVMMRDSAGRRVAFAQIAGLVARRIINRLTEGQRLALGERYGLIRFGSRAEVWMQPGSRVEVVKGQKVVAGVSVLGRLPVGAPVAEVKPALGAPVAS